MPRQIDLHCEVDAASRPTTYWDTPDDPLAVILDGVQGTARREMIRDYWKAGMVDELDDALLQDELDEKTRKSLGRIHPFFMGGEYLPRTLPGERRIVRIQLQSTMYDVTELRARPLPDGRIGLRWVDEHETDFNQPCTSVGKPFSLGELITFMDQSNPGEREWGGLPLVYSRAICDSMLGNGGCKDFEQLREFTSVDSDYYPELRKWFDRFVHDWIEGIKNDYEEEVTT